MAARNGMSLEDIRQIWNGWTNDEDVASIAERTGHEQRTVLDLAMQIEEVTPNLADEIVLARAGGMKLSEIRDKYGVSYHAVRYFCDGVYRRPKYHRKGRKRRGFAGEWEEMLQLFGR